MDEMKTARVTAIASLTFALLAAVPHGRAEEGITAFLAPDGRIVFTNLAVHPSPPAPAPPPVRATPFGAIIESAAVRHGIDSTLIRAVIEIESAFDRHAVSPKGALGLMQLIPETGARFGVRDFFDPAQNIEGGVRYLRFLLEKFQGDLDLSLAAYNSGENRVERLGRIPAIPETQDYVRKVRSAYLRMGGYLPLRPVEIAASGGLMATGSDAGEIYRSVDRRGVLRFSNIDPVR